MRGNKIWLGIIFLFIGHGMKSQDAIGQHPEVGSGIFKHFTIDDGLSNSWVSDIHQDQHGFIWLATRYGLNRFDGTRFENYYYNSQDTSSLSNNWAICIDEDSEGHLWIGNYGLGINEYAPQEKLITRYYSKNGEKCSWKNIGKLHIASDGSKFLFGQYRRLYYLENNSSCPELLDGNLVGMDIEEDDGFIWISSQTGITRIEKRNVASRANYFAGKKITTLLRHTGNLFFVSDGNLFQTEVRNGEPGHLKVIQQGLPEVKDMTIQKNLIWLAGSDGLYVFNIITGDFTAYKHSSGNLRSIIDGELLSILADRDGNVWVGGRKGLCLLTIPNNPFESKKYSQDLSDHQAVRAIESDEHYIWVGAANGLWRYARDKSAHTEAIQILNIPIRSLLLTSSGTLYAGTSAQRQDKDRVGLYRIDTSNLEFELLRHDSSDINSINYGHIWDIEEYNEQGLFLSVSGFLNYYDFRFGQFTRLNDKVNFDLETSDFIIDIELDKDNQLWLATTQTGLLRVNAEELLNGMDCNAVDHFHQDISGIQKIGSNILLDMYQTSNGEIWISSDGGIEVYDPITKDFRHYSILTHGIQDDKTVSVIGDQSGRIWLGTISHGLLMIDEKNGTINYYGEQDGVYNNSSLLGATHVSNTGTLFIANEGGLQVFNPESTVRTKNTDSDILFTRLEINGDNVELNRDNPLTSAPEFTTQIQLRYNQNNLNFSYAFPEYRDQGHYKMEYLLKGGSNEWTEIDDIANIQFANLASGRYILEVRACNNGDCIQSSSLNIQLNPPWWYSVWAYVFYACLLFVIASVVVKKRINSKLKKEKIKHDHELAEVKSRFFINMTHELRTPLTLIEGPLRRILTNPKATPTSVIKTLEGIEKHTTHLHRLIDNVLDISKIDAGAMLFQPTRTEIFSFIEGIIESFSAMALQKHIEIEHRKEGMDVSAMVDREKIQIILSNLISNALKYSDSHTHICIHTSIQENVEIDVVDQGHGIPGDQISKVFERFYRGGGQELINGNGIGLSLAKEIAEFLNGRIELRSDVGKGTSVKVSIPLIDPTSIHENAFHAKVKDIDYDARSRSNVPLIILCEDNEEIAKFIISGLDKQYDVQHYKNGLKGYHQAVQSIPDLIIADVMMPEMDGFELCNHIKENPLTDHIPVIFLSARSDIESRIEGLSYGADGYLNKPFYDQELNQLIRNTLLTRQNVLSKLSRSAVVNAVEYESTFLIALEQVMWDINEHGDVTIERICMKLDISRTQLHRKIKALKNQSTTQYLNSVKLKRGTSMLLETELSITDIAFQCGFKDPSYFSQLFHKKYACTPSKFRERSVIQMA